MDADKIYKNQWIAAQVLRARFLKNQDAKGGWWGLKVDGQDFARANMRASVSRRSACVKTSSARDVQAFRYIKVAIGPKTFSTSSNDALFKSRY